MARNIIEITIFGNGPLAEKKLITFDELDNSIIHPGLLVWEEIQRMRNNVTVPVRNPPLSKQDQETEEQRQRDFGAFYNHT